MKKRFSIVDLYLAVGAAVLVLCYVSRGEGDQGGEKRRTMAYVLQADRLARTRGAAVKKLASCDRDVVVLDCSFDGDVEGRWTTQDLETIRSGKPGRKVIAYLSIGEAEDYRPYWQKSWDANKDGKPDKGAPSFLETVNPDWEGNYRVRYWDSQWQAIILRYLDDIVAQGFDGVYLDIVDAFEFYEHDAATGQWIDDRTNLATGRTYRQDMVLWVKAMAGHARQSRSGFMIVPQNGVQLLAQPGYVEMIDAIGVEDLFTDGDKLQDDEHVSMMIGFLKLMLGAGKPVFVIEYGRRRPAQAQTVKQAGAAGYSWLLTDRELTGVGRAGVQ